jgi:uncharacterized protein involved in outer membrane biogenesis
MSRTLKWIGLGVVALTLLIAAVVVLLDANHLRGTIARLITERTGRQLAINGDLQWKLDWPQIRLHAIDVTFANPPWAREKQMIEAQAVELSVDLPLLLRGALFLPEVQLDRPVVFFERGADGRKNWLLDQEQQDEDARISIGRLTLEDGRVGYDDPLQDTSIVAEISARHTGPATVQVSTADPGIAFNASGKYRGLPLTASGSGGPVLALGDERTPYPLAVVATVGPTSIRAEGTVTSLMKNSAVDVNIALRGASLAELFDLLPIPLPETHAYSLAGHLTHSANGWRYEKFSGRIGQSDVVGSLHVTSGAARPLVEGELAFKSLNLADLGPVLGKEAASTAQQTSLRGRKVAERDAGPGSRALPALPFRRDRWTNVDADVHLKAQTILRPKALPLEHLTARLRMRESVLTLDPLDFGVAGGDLVGMIRLDGQRNPIHAHAKLEVRNLLLGKLLPTIALAQNSVGQINGEIELVGHGDSIARMLATADGKVGLVVQGGQISKLLMEQVALHVPEMVLQQITGDKLIDIRCGVADFNVEHGVMKVGALVLDTDVTKIVGTGSVDLAKETLSLTLIPSPKRLSLFALRGPISVRGDLAHPDLAVDAGRVGARGLAAVALAAINPVLSLIVLADPGSGKDSECNALTKQAQAPWHKTASAEKRAPV